MQKRSQVLVKKLKNHPRILQAISDNCQSRLCGCLVLAVEKLKKHPRIL